MLNLITSDFCSFMEAVKQIKGCCENCIEDVEHYFSNFSADIEDFEYNAMEELSMLPFCDDYDELYDESDENTPEDEREAIGEQWKFSNDDMTEYYKTLDSLYSNKVITEEKYNQECREMVCCIQNNICGTDATAMFCRLVYADADEENRDNIRIYLYYYDGYYSLFDLYCSLIVVFDRYKFKLKQLKETYCGEKQMLEAA